MAGDPNLIVRITANIEQFRAALAAGKEQVNVTSRAIEKLAGSYDGNKIISQALKTEAAIRLIGGASSLTAGEAQRVSKQMEAALEKARLLGIQAPPEIRKLADETRHATERSKEHTLSIAGMAAGYLGAMATWEGAKRLITGLVGFIGSSVEAYAKEEAAVKKLSAALQSQGQISAGTVRAYRDMASGLQAMTIYGDDAVLSAQALLVQVGGVLPRDMERALKATTDLASGLGVDLEAATMLVAKAFAGNTGTLARYGVIVDETQLKLRGIDAVLDTVNAKFGGQAAAALDTTAGRLQQAANLWGDLKEKIGEAVATDPLVQVFLRNTTDALKEMNAVAEQTPGFSPMLITLAATNPMLAQLVDALRLVAEDSNRAATAQKVLGELGLKPVAAHAASLTVAVSHNTAAMQAQQEQAAKVVAWLGMLRGSVVPLTEAQEAAATEALRLGASTAEVAEHLRISEMVIKRHVDALKDEEDAFKKAEKAAEKFRESVKRLPFNMLYGDVQQTARAVEEHAAKNDILAAAYGRLIIPTSEFHGYMEKLPGTIRPVHTALIDAAREANNLGGAIQTGLLGVLETLPRTLEQAFLGGGGIAGAFKALGAQVGGMIGGAISERIAFELSASLGTKLGTALAGAIGGLAGGGIAAAISGIGMMLASIFSTAKWDAKVKAYEDAAKAIATMQWETQKLYGGWTALLSVADALGVELREVWYGVGVEGAEALQEALAELTGRYSALQSAMDRYGLSWQNLGPTMRQAEVDKLARALFDDFTLLTNAGVGTADAVAGMAKSLNQLILDAEKTGTQIPAYLKPIITQLIEMGLVTDQNAGKVEAINAKYEEQAAKIKGVLSSLTDELDRLNASEAPEEVMGIIEQQTRERIAAEQEVARQRLAQIEAQRREEIDALAVATHDFETLFKKVVTESGTAAALVAKQWALTPWEHWLPVPVPGIPTAPAPHYQEGTHGRFVDFGSGTLAVLHGRERITPEHRAEAEDGGRMTGAMLEELRGLRRDFAYLPQQTAMLTRDMRLLQVQ